MKKKMLYIISSILFVATLLGVSPASAAAVSCSPMKAVSVIGTAANDQVGFKNIGGGTACGGNMAAGEIGIFYGVTKSQLALVLTGIALGKTFVVWADFPSHIIASISIEDQ